MNSATTLPKPSTDAHQRRGLLAKIHIAKSQMGLSDDEYSMILKSFKVDSAASMTIPQLENMIKLMKHYGWKEQAKWRKPAKTDAQVYALRERVRELTLEITNGEQRLPGLIKKICKVDVLVWCNDVDKLERLLAVLGKIKEG